MAIGTAQPTAEEQDAVHHHYVDCFPVTQQQSAADFEDFGLQVLEEIFREKDVAVVCGGTGLYLKALLEGLDEMPQTDPEIAALLEREYKANGPQILREKLLTEDPKTFAAIDNHNPARLLRALAFFRSTGKSLLDFQQQQPKERPFRTVKIALELPREILYERVNHRVDAMMKAGLLEEVKSFLPHQHLRPLNTVGYAEIFRHLNGEWTLETAIEKLKQHTRNYAKRQMTWFRNVGDYAWLRADAEDISTQLLQALSASQV